jgi:hypothetical protein
VAAESRSEQHQKPRDPGQAKPRDIKSQGIVRGERGQEQPADKERAQQTSKNQ